MTKTGNQKVVYKNTDCVPQAVCDSVIKCKQNSTVILKTISYVSQPPTLKQLIFF